MILPGYADRPTPMLYAHPRHDEFVRTFEPFIATLRSDAEAWDALIDDEARLRIFRAVYGNRKGRRPKKLSRLAEVVCLPFDQPPAVVNVAVGTALSEAEVS